MLRYILPAGVALIALSAPAHAADFNEANGIVTYENPCYVASSTGAFASGTVLTGANQTNFDCHGGASITIDTTAHTITLTGNDVGNYDSSSIDITNIEGLTITGFSAISWIPLFDPNALGYPGYYGALPTPELSFTANSLHIGFSSYGDSPPQFTFSNGGQAVFSYQAVAGAVPEPASWALMLAGFGLAGGAMRSARRRTAVRFG